MRRRSAVSSIRSYFTPTDALLLLVVIIWGSNFAVIKATVEQIPPLGFNALRLALACPVLVVIARYSGVALPRRSDWSRLIGLGLAGQCGYQLLFVLGLARTSVTNSSLILGCLPVAVLLLNAVSRRREPVGRWQWAGVVLAIVGVYLVVGVGAEVARETLSGDLLIIGSVWCWAWYTIGSRRLLQRYSPLQVTVCTMATGSVAFLPFAVPSLIGLDWREVTWWAWPSTAGSGLLALSLCYVLWYTGVQRLGVARTSVYSNLVPVVAMTVAAVTLGEPIGPIKAIGAALVLTALVLTRVERSARPV